MINIILLGCKIVCTFVSSNCKSLFQYEKILVLYTALLLLLAGCRYDELFSEETTPVLHSDKNRILLRITEESRKHEDETLNCKNDANMVVHFVQSLKAYLREDPDVEQEIVEKYGI